MRNLQQITSGLRKSKTPTGVNQQQWANAVNWTIEAWKCHLAGQQWTHQIEICAPEQYYALLDKCGNLIVKNTQLIGFKNNIAINKWMHQLKDQIVDMRARGEFNEAIRYNSLVQHIAQFVLPTPNETALKRNKKNVVKGHKLIRIKPVA